MEGLGAKTMGDNVCQGLFVIGTDTGVGKTTIAGAMARSLISRGIDCGVMKPIETGCHLETQDLIPTDGSYLKAAARSSDALHLITPCRYQAPLAPYAATLQGEDDVDFPAIQAACQHLQAKHDFLIIEGLGGLMVPLTAQRDLVDLIKKIGLPVLLIARSGLGTLNHSLLTIRYGTEHGIDFLGLVLNRTRPEQEASEKTNIEILSRRITLPVTGPFPYLNPHRRKEDLIEESRVRFDQNTGMKALLDSLAIRKKSLR